jgi:hypothetical protein
MWLSVVPRRHSATADKDSHSADFAERQLEKLMSITREEAAETLRKATNERDEAVLDLKRATERVNRAANMLNSALMVNGQLSSK